MIAPAKSPCLAFPHSVVSGVVPGIPRYLPGLNWRGADVDAEGDEHQTPFSTAPSRGRRHGRLAHFMSNDSLPERFEKRLLYMKTPQVCLTFGPVQETLILRLYTIAKA